MARRQVPPATARPDDTKLIVGSEGTPLDQSAGKLITRVGVQQEDADFDVDTDLVANGDRVIGPVNIGGTAELEGGFISQDGEAFDVIVEFLSDPADDTTRTVLFSETFSATDSSPDLDLLNIGIRGERVRITVTDTSGAGQNVVTGTVNFHV